MVSHHLFYRDQQRRIMDADSHLLGPAEEHSFEGTAEHSGPVEDLIPNSVRFGRDPNSSQPLDTAIYGYDIAQMKERPWAKAGADPSDYFNYGFEETTWRAYCAMQAMGIESLKARAEKMIAEIRGSGVPAVQAQQGGFSHTPNNYSGHFSSNTFSSHRDGNRDRDAHQPREQFYKTQLCKGFLSGTCSRGQACNYAHGHAELRHITHSDRAPGPSGPSGGGVVGSMPPPVPIPTMGVSSSVGGGMPIPPMPLPMGMPIPPPPVFAGGASAMPIARPQGEGVLSVPPAAVPPAATPQAPAQAAPKGPAGFRILPQQKRDREKSPESVTY